jgi:hypothetical protein
MTTEIIKLINEEYVGKTFIYKSKYGGFTEIVCDKISYYDEVLFDENTTLKLQAFINSKKGGAIHNKISLKELNEIKKESKWLATLKVLNITSTKGQVYDFNECYLKINYEKRIYTL